MTNRRTLVILRGGLGNQLFQYVAGLYASAGGKLIIETGFPDRTFPRGQELSSLELDKDTEIIFSRKKEKMTSRIVDVGFGLSSRPSTSRVTKGMRIMYKLFASVYFSIYYKSLFIVYLSHGTGYSKINLNDSNKVLIGYFQTFKYFNELTNLPSFKCLGTVKNETILNYKFLSESERPLIVHQRLGDYLQNSSIGIPGKPYLTKALQLVWDPQIFSRIWLFSDDIENARKNIPEVLQRYIRVIDDTKLSPAEVLEIMKQGKSYIIANSTFSWWAAMLRYDKTAQVIAPEPWFQVMSSPIDLIPDSWARLDASFDSEGRL
jgi:hypothetical protein